MAIPGGVGTAVRELDGQRCIKVLVTESAYELAARIPAAVEGHRVVIEETGEFRVTQPQYGLAIGRPVMVS